MRIVERILHVERGRVQGTQVKQKKYNGIKLSRAQGKYQLNLIKTNTNNVHMKNNLIKPRNITKLEK